MFFASGCEHSGPFIALCAYHIVGDGVSEEWAAVA